jgi:hypothetical protein
LCRSAGPVKALSREHYRCTNRPSPVSHWCRITARSVQVLVVAFPVRPSQSPTRPQAEGKPPPPPRPPPVRAHVSERAAEEQKPTQSPMADVAAQDSTEQQLLYLKLAFLAGEPPACVLALARYAPPLAASQNRNGTQRSPALPCPFPSDS